MVKRNLLSCQTLMYRRSIRKRIQYLVMGHVLPLTAYERRIHADAPKIFANSIPKAGTNLLSRLLRSMPNVIPKWTYHIDETIPGFKKQIATCSKGQVITAHLPWSEELSVLLEDLDFKKLFIVRDMRDVVVSGAHYVTHMDKSHPLHEYMNSLDSSDKRLMAMICGVDAKFYPGGVIPDEWENDSYRSFFPWIDDGNCLSIKFEDLIGSAGGGSDELQHETIKLVARHIGAKLNTDQLEQIRTSVFSTSSRTFRKGQINDWRNHFTTEHKAVFKQKSGDMLIKMGYEENNDW